MAGSVRIRHGVVFDPLLGYRAVREWDGERSFLGPWTTEEQAQRNAEEASRITHEVIDGRGVPRTKGDTPLGVWVPRSKAQP